MINDVNSLNETFYALFSRVGKYREFMTDMEYKYIHQCLFELYKEEYKLLVLTHSIERKTSLYELEQRCSEMIPRRRLSFFRNRQAKLIDKILSKEFDEAYKKRIEELKCMHDIT